MKNRPICRFGSCSAEEAVRRAILQDARSSWARARGARGRIAPARGTSPHYECGRTPSPGVREPCYSSPEARACDQGCDQPGLEARSLGGSLARPAASGGRTPAGRQVWARCSASPGGSQPGSRPCNAHCSSLVLGSSIGPKGCKINVKILLTLGLRGVCSGCRR